MYLLEGGLLEGWWLGLGGILDNSSYFCLGILDFEVAFFLVGYVNEVFYIVGCGVFFEFCL